MEGVRWCNARALIYRAFSFDGVVRHRFYYRYFAFYLVQKMSISNFPGSSVATVAKPKFVLPANLVASLVNGDNPAVKSPTSPAPSVSLSRSVEPKIQVDAGCNRVDGSAEAVTNAEFIAAIFGSMPEGTSALVCSKPGDPTTGPWVAKPATQVETACSAHLNNYFNCSSVRAGTDGECKAKKENAESYRCLVLDDVGTKVALAHLRDFKASWVLETSPGNFQVGYILAQPLTSATEVTQLQDMVITGGLCDPGANGMMRWMRLPVGINGKEKYRSASGQPFQCRLEKWRPDARYTVDEIVAGLKLEMVPVKAPVQHVTQDARMVVDVTAAPAKAIDPADVAKLPQLLAAIDPDCSRPEWLHALMAVYHTTGGSDAGFELVDTWSSKGTKYPGTKDLETQWRSFSGSVQRPITIGTLIMMARDAGADVTATAMGSEAFEPCETEVVSASESLATVAALRDASFANPLTKYSLRDSLEELEKQRVEQVLILGDIVLKGQATVIYALANTGKTLILIHLIIEGIKKGLIDPSRLHYINMDDNSSGLVDKVRLAQEYGFHMLADGHKGFQAKEFREAMVKMIETNTARGAIVVLDTLKKFVNTMNKDESRSFARVVRQFSLKGGTVIALSHANKNPGADGKIKYTGTTDIVDDFDCAYTLQTISEQNDTNLKVVEFTNIKRRGDVALSAAYSYAQERGLSYSELLSSVQEMDPDELKPIKHAAEISSDATVIAAIEASIAEGVVTKMKLVDAAAERASVATRRVLKVIEKYTGKDPAAHRWTYTVRDRGANVFELLARPTAPSPAVLETPAQLPVDLAQVQQDAGLPEPAMVAALTGDEQFHIGILGEAIALYGGDGSTDGQTQAEY